MPYLPQLPEVATYRMVTDVFSGLDRNIRAEDGTFVDMTNMSGDDYPVLSSRKPWTGVKTLSSSNYYGITAKGAIVYVEGSKLYYDFTQVAGITLSTAPDMVPKTFVSMGAYLLIWPDKVYVNTADIDNDKGNIEQVNTTDGNITYTLCKEDGTAYGPATVSGTAPANPSNGDLWIDNSGEIHALFQYDKPSGQWVEIATTYVKIQATGIGRSLKQYDGITLSGCEYNNDDQIAALNGDVIVYNRKNNYIVIVGIIDQAVTQTSGTVTAARTVPDMDYICESQNRLWGCKYGLVDGKIVNEIRCCALGDFRNWIQFLGLSTDSWVASQGTDGPWTGAITHLGYPLFFKENVLHKVYISSQGAHQVVTQACRGVADGNSKSLAIVDEHLYYVSRFGVMRYDGSLPVLISDKLGSNETPYDVVGGAFQNKYYMNARYIMMAGNAWYYVWKTYVYDTRTGCWYGDAPRQIVDYVQFEGKLYFVDKEQAGIGSYFYHINYIDSADSNKYSDPNEYSGISWSATTGLIGLEYPDQKRMSRFVIRLDLAENYGNSVNDAGSKYQIDVQYDSNGVWICVASGTGRGIGTMTVPVVPRRCDHMQIRISGAGPVKIYSFSKVFEMSGDKQ